MDHGLCEHCEVMRVERDAALAEVRALRTRVEREQAVSQKLADQVDQLSRLARALESDIARFRQQAARPMPPNCPERVPVEQLVLALKSAIAEATRPANENVAADAAADASGGKALEQTLAALQSTSARPDRTRGTARPHGRRNLDLSSLPQKVVYGDPPEVLKDGGVGWVQIGEHVSHRLGYRAASFVDLVYVQRVFKRQAAEPIRDASSSQIVTAPLPPFAWPGVMADASAVAAIAVGKYGDHLPLHRQQTIFERHGFHLPRSTQCDWLLAGHAALYRVVNAMFGEMTARCEVIASDATSAPLQVSGGTVNHAVMVFIGDDDQVVFKHARRLDGDLYGKLLARFSGTLVVDAASVYGPLFRRAEIDEAGCWAHARRYFWKALGAQKALALEGIAIIGALFAADRECAAIPMPERTAVRAERCTPLLSAFDHFIQRARTLADPRGPLESAVTYCTHQRAPLRQFLQDGAIPIHNNRSEAALRALVLGRDNWRYFAATSGLHMYCTYRSLIASSLAAGLNPETYLEQVLRLASSWCTSRMVELAPKHWRSTLTTLSEHDRLRIQQPWEADPSSLALPQPARTSRTLRAA